MKFYLPVEPYDHRFAVAGRRGTWTDGYLCPECQRTTERRVPPLIIEWEPGADLVGDFVWPGFGDDVVVTERVAEGLRNHFRGFEFGPVQMTQDSRLKRPVRITKRTKPRVWLPYDGPPLYELIVDTFVPVDRERTTAKLVRNRCETCGRGETYEYDITGVERIDGRVERRRGEFLIKRTRIQRVPGQGLFVREHDLQGADIFGVYRFGGRERSVWTFFTERVKTFIEKEGFTNVRFLEYGDVI